MLRVLKNVSNARSNVFSTYAPYNERFNISDIDTERKHGIGSNEVRCLVDLVIVNNDVVDGSFYNNTISSLPP